MKNLEKENYRVNSKWRVIKDWIAYIKWEKTKVKYKENPEWDIREYYKWFPKEFIGEQLFDWSAVERLWLGKRLPTYEQIKDLKDFSLAGYRSPNGNEGFFNVGVRSYVWLVGGDYAGFYQDESGCYNNNRGFGFSGRLLEELDDSSIWQFDYLLDWAKENWITVKAYEELKVLIGK